jgi:glycosyltransferase involved in cell wall biosynthesis
MSDSIAVITPTYNRKKLITRVYESLICQTYKNFVWYIVDDGSTDNTNFLIKEFIEEGLIEIRYIYKENSGKAKSLNYCMPFINEDFTIVFDSDDWCLPNALERFIFIWNKIEDKENFCSISCLKSYKNKQVVGDDYNGFSGNSYIDRYNSKVTGDKWEFIRTDLFKTYKYSNIVNEKYQAPSFQWISMSKRYKTYFLNECLSIIEYMPDGISLNNIKYRMNSPKGCVEMYKLLFDVSKGYYLKIKSAVNIYRFQFHSNDGIKLHTPLSYFIFVIGISYLMYLHDSK